MLSMYVELYSYRNEYDILHLLCISANGMFPSQVPKRQQPAKAMPTFTKHLVVANVTWHSLQGCVGCVA